MVPSRPLAVWIGLALVAGVAGAAEVGSRHDAPPAAVSTFDPSFRPGTTTSTTAAPTETSTSAATATTATRPRVTTTTTIASSTGPAILDSAGLWVGSTSGGPARRIAASCAGQGGLQFRFDGSAVDEELGGPFTSGQIRQHGLDGSTRTATVGFRFVRSGHADLAVFLSEDARSMVFVDSDLRSNRVEVPLPADLGASPDAVLRPDGQAVALFADGKAALYRRDGVPLVDWAPSTSSFMTWTTDGEWLVVAKQHPAGADGVRVDGTGAHDLGMGVPPQEIALGPGSTIAYLDFDPDQDTVPDVTGTTRPSDSADRIPVVVVDVASGRSRTIAQGTVHDIAWSPAGGPVLWQGARDGQAGIYATSADGATTRLLVKGTRYRQELPEINDWTWAEHAPFHPAVSRDGTTWAACAG